MIRGLALGCALAVATMPATAWANDTTTFALIVTNNSGMALDRPALAYADDDGARYHELFSTITAPANVVLLTEFDNDTAGLFPKLAQATQTPSKANLENTVAQLAARVAREKAAGRNTQLYFVYAGHGDVDRGRGFLELADGTLDARGLAALLRTIGATESHVILDSCNSFFMISPRKPGGRRFATPKDAVARLAKDLPNVGVFLSTSAEAEVFEWSELQSGIFSHLVRSGLAGAADANGDSRVSYAELKGFVSIASKTIRNPRYRPRVFSRGPNGHTDAALVDWRGSSAPSITLDTKVAQRVRVVDTDGLPWIDTFKEPATAATLWLSPRAAELQQLATDGRGRRIEHTYSLARAQAGQRLSLAQLSSASSAQKARGSSAIFGRLFATPFGPRALAQFVSDEQNAEPVFGISTDDSDRMKMLLRHTAGVDRQQRFIKAGVIVGAGLVFAGSGAYLLETREQPLRPLATQTRQGQLGIGMVAIGLGVSAVGVIFGAQESGGERAHRLFRLELTEFSDDPARAVANAERRMAKLQKQERSWRRALSILSFLTAGVSAAGIVGNEIWSPDRFRTEARYLLIGGTLGGLVGGFALQGNITPVERMTHIWREDPAIRRLPGMRVNVAPTDGGALVSVGGSF